jgi:hypothetical protein
MVCTYILHVPINNPATWSLTQATGTALYGFGSRPSVAICDTYFDVNDPYHGFEAIEVHQGSNADMIADYTGFDAGSGALYSNSKTGAGGWNLFGKYGSGYLPKVSCEDNIGQEVHAGTNATSGPLWTSGFKPGN